MTVLDVCVAVATLGAAGSVVCVAYVLWKERR